MRIIRIFPVMLCLFLLAPALHAFGQTEAVKKEAVSWVAAHEKELNEAALAIHGFAETGLEEYRSAKLLSDLLEGNGFRLEHGVAEMPTAFVASWGSGKPVIGIVAEYDALPGLSQKGGEPAYQPVAQDAPGHGCGHNLFGVASVSAALAMKTVMEKHGLPGTVKLYGCPAEETLVGKVFMVKAGVFRDLDACLSWHPDSNNHVGVGTSRAMNSFEVIFRGKTAHAAADPWNGRSALDAVELMSVGVNYLREHSRETVRIHSMIKHGGEAPNIVPEYARVWYFVRDSSRKGMESVYERVLKCAEGAALMTGTTMELNFITGVYHRLSNRTLSETLHRNLTAIGPPRYTEAELAYARALQKSLGVEEKGMDGDVDPLGDGTSVRGGSTDVADVSWVVPTSGDLYVATNPSGIPAHHWGVVSSSGSSIGLKGMLTAGKVLAASGVELLMEPELVEKAKAEFRERTKGFTYKSPLPDGAKPPFPEVKN